MPRSMTGFGAATAEAGGATAAVEVRSVNNRFLKIQTRLPDGAAAVEPRVEAAVRTALTRGAVTVNVRVDRDAGPARFALDPDALDAYRRDAVALAERAGLAAPTDLAPFLRLPGVVRETAAAPSDPAADWPAVAAALASALNALTAFRTREGAAMADKLRDLLAVLRSHLDAVEARAPTLAEEYRTKLHARTADLLAAAGADVSPADLTREVILYADKADLTEELTRLRTHLDAFDAALTEPAPGRTLDFLVQEIVREANTVGSKANDADLAGAVVGMKGAVESVREILQNLE